MHKTKAALILTFFTILPFVLKPSFASEFLPQELLDRVRAANKAANAWKLEYAPLVISGESRERLSNFLVLSNGYDLLNPESAWACVDSYGDDIGYGFFDDGAGMLYREDISVTPKENTTVFFWREKAVNDRLVLSIEFANRDFLTLSGFIYFKDAKQLEFAATDADGHPSYLSCEHILIE